MAPSPSLSALKSRAFRVKRRYPRPVKTAEIAAAIALIESLPLSHADSVLLVRIVKRLAKQVWRAKRSVRQASWRHGQLATRYRTTRELIDNAGDLNRQLRILLDRHQPGRGNMYARAHGKRTALKLGLEHYKKIGAIGAESRWRVHRLARAIAIAASSQIDWRLF